LPTLERNRTQGLIGDIEAVRAHLGIERWLVSGASWGTTLALASALEHPERVTELVLVAVTATSCREVDWLTHDRQRVFPEAWDRRAGASGQEPGERIICADARRLARADPADRALAADAWDAWEATHMGRPGRLHEDPVTRLVYATLVTHDWSHDAFRVGDGAILNRAAGLGHIPTVLIHGRLDVSGPAITPWLLHQAVAGSRLSIVEAEGHGGPVMMELMCEAIDTFAA
jgi:proline iminopeptidase